MANSTNTFLANCISIFHVAIIAFMLIVPFMDVPILLFLHIIFGINLIVHWACNSNVCSLSLLEASLRGKVYNQSFTHQIISPFYDISENDWSTVVYITTILLIFQSINKLYNSEKLKLFFKTYRDEKEKRLNRNNSSTLSLREWFSILDKAGIHLLWA